MKPTETAELCDYFHDVRAVNTASGSTCSVCGLPVYWSAQGWRHRRKRRQAPRKPGVNPEQLSFPADVTRELLGPAE